MLSRIPPSDRLNLSHPVAEYPIALFDLALVQAGRAGSAELRSRRAVARAWPGSGELGWRRRNSAAGTIRRTLPCPSRIVTGAMNSSCEGSLTAIEESFIAHSSRLNSFGPKTSAVVATESLPTPPAPAPLRYAVGVIPVTRRNVVVK